MHLCSIFIPTQNLILFYAFFVLDQAFNLCGDLKFNTKSNLATIGIYTYGLYLLHPLPILFFQHAFDYLGFDYKTSLFSAFALGTVSFPLTILLGYLSYTYFESYFLKLKDSFYQKKKKCA